MFFSVLPIRKEVATFKEFDGDIVAISCGFEAVLYFPLISHILFWNQSFKTHTYSIPSVLSPSMMADESEECIL